MEYKNKNEHRGDIVGSPELCAPEMTNRLEYDYNSDYYRLGSMIYFLIFRKYPNNIRKEKNITDIKINIYDKSKYSLSCMDFINKLLIFDKTKRIGYSKFDEIVNHSFFNDFNWEKFFKKSMNSPFPKIPRSSLRLCNKNISFPKKIDINTTFSKNLDLRNKIFAYDNINDKIINMIFRNIKEKII